MYKYLYPTSVEMQEVDYLLMWAIIMYVRTTIVNHLHFTNCIIILHMVNYSLDI